MPRNPIQTLLDRLQDTHEVYRRLLTIAEEKKTHILGNDLDSLRADIEAEETLSRKGADLNAVCDELRGECLRALGRQDGAGTLEDLTRLLPADRRKPLEQERGGLKDTLRKLRDRNRMNMALVNSSLDVMEGLLSAMFGTETVSTYGRRGRRTRSGPPARALNARV